MKRAALERWFDAGVGRLHCLPWDADTGLRWAALLARLRSTGQAMPITDSMIAATALVHDLTVVTRNAPDFRKAGRQGRGPVQGIKNEKAPRKGAPYTCYAPPDA